MIVPPVKFISSIKLVMNLMMEVKQRLLAEEEVIYLSVK